MSKTYHHPPYIAPYVIQLPLSVKQDRTLNWTDRIAYHFFVVHQGDIQKVCDEMNLSDRRFREIKQRLADRGHIARVEEKGQIKYIAVDLDTSALLRIQKFREVSKCGFAKVPDSNLYALKGKGSQYDYMLYVMEVLEWTYRKSGKQINNPHAMLARSCKNDSGVTPAADFQRGFWEADIAEKAKREKESGLTLHKQAKAEERRILEDQDFGRYLKSIDPAARKKLEDEARKSLGTFFSFVSKKTQETIVLEKMKEIVTERRHHAGTA